jgi:hypothetical protein
METRPEIVTDEHLEYLDDLRESGVTNMFGAGAYLREDFPDLSRAEASEILQYWMHTFTERHTKE